MRRRRSLGSGRKYPEGQPTFPEHIPCQFSKFRAIIGELKIAGSRLPPAISVIPVQLKREDMPEPNYLISSSPGKWQAWKIQDCSKSEAEGVERGLVRDTGADPAVIDIARVLRLPGFYNHKYDHPHLVTVKSRSEKISRPEQFPRFASESRDDETSARRSNLPPGRITQSERDWAYVRGALRQGAPPEGLIEELKVPAFRQVQS